MVERPASLEIVAMIAAYLAMMAVKPPPSAIAFALAGLLAVTLIWLSLCDLAVKEVPDFATLMVAVLGLSASWGDLTVLAENALAAGTMVLVLGLGSELIWRTTGRDVLGLGDIKLIGAGVLVVGAASAWFMILLASAGGILAALLARRRQERGIPFGPFLAYAIFITYLMIEAHA